MLLSRTNQYTIKSACHIIYFRFDEILDDEKGQTFQRIENIRENSQAFL